VTGPLTGDGERAWWQRRAAAELAAILDAHQDLPRIAWTVGPAGSVLVGHVNALAPAALVRATFTAWESALALGERHEDQLGSGAAWVHAACRRRDVTVRLTATVLDEDEGQ
jgi:hypothetical protein